MEPLGDWLFLAPMTTVALTGTLSVGPTQPIRSLGLSANLGTRMLAAVVPPQHMDISASIGLGRGAVDGPTSRPYLVTISPITLFGDGYPAPKPNVTPLGDEANVMRRPPVHGGAADRDPVSGMSRRYPPRVGIG